MTQSKEKLPLTSEYFAAFIGSYLFLFSLHDTWASHPMSLSLRSAHPFRPQEAELCETSLGNRYLNSSFLGTVTLHITTGCPLAPLYWQTQTSDVVLPPKRKSFAMLWLLWLGVRLCRELQILLCKGWANWYPSTHTLRLKSKVEGPQWAWTVLPLNIMPINFFEDWGKFCKSPIQSLREVRFLVQAFSIYNQRCSHTSSTSNNWLIISGITTISNFSRCNSSWHHFIIHLRVIIQRTGTVREVNRVTE